MSGDINYTNFIFLKVSQVWRGNMRQGVSSKYFDMNSDQGRKGLFVVVTNPL